MVMNGVEYLIGQPGMSVRPMEPYSDEACEFLRNLSVFLLHDFEAKEFPDVISFAYWCRKANIEKLKSGFICGNKRLGRGLAFHIAPSNVPVNFAFSYVFSLLAGNGNIVRVPSKEFPQVSILCRGIRAVLEEFPEIRRQTAFVKYSSSGLVVPLCGTARHATGAATSSFCEMADIRMIWGGDDTVKTIRALPTKPRCVDVVFADRYSICILDGQAVLRADDSALERLAERFYNDTFLMDQNACSSPQTIFWHNHNQEARTRFWRSVLAYAKKKYFLQPETSIDKYTLLCENAAQYDCIRRCEQFENLLYLSEFSALPKDLTEFRGKGGFFYEFIMDSFHDVAQVINEKFQTITYFGVDAAEVAKKILEWGVTGVDRIVPIGSAMDIGVIWDGYDLIRTLSREVYFV